MKKELSSAPPHTHIHNLLSPSQVMVFVHARNATIRTAMGLIEMAKNRGETVFFQPEQGPDYGQCDKQVRVLARRPRSSSPPDMWTPVLVV